MVIKHKTLLSFTLRWIKFLILTGTFSVLDAFLFSHSCYKCYYSRKFVKKKKISHAEKQNSRYVVD